jgi:transposase
MSREGRSARIGRGSYLDHGSGRRGSDAWALVDHHDAATCEARFNDRLHAFADYWDFRPRAYAPYRAHTKGKDERGVAYVKKNAVASHSFLSWPAFEAHLDW